MNTKQKKELFIKLLKNHFMFFDSSKEIKIIDYLRKVEWAKIIDLSDPYGNYDIQVVFNFPYDLYMNYWCTLVMCHELEFLYIKQSSLNMLNYEIERCINYLNYNKINGVTYYNYFIKLFETIK